MQRLLPLVLVLWEQGQGQGLESAHVHERAEGM